MFVPSVHYYFICGGVGGRYVFLFENKSSVEGEQEERGE